MNKSHSDFLLGICQKMGDSSAAVATFHLCRSYCINARRSPGETINVRFSLNISQLKGGKQLNLCYVDQQYIFEHSNLQYKLLNVIIKLKYGRIVLHLLSF